MSIPARADRRPNGLQSGAKVGGISGQTEAEMHTPRCTRAPEVGGRKACPVFSQETGMRFRSRPQPENASRSERGIWDAVSAKSRKRKARPILTPDSGMQFPQEPSAKEKDPFAEALVNSRWRGRESRPRAARTDRCGACAPCELRWQTLTRLLSSAPSRGSIPRGCHIKEKDPFAEVLVNSRWRGRESNP